MDIQITSRHTKASPSLQNTIMDELNKLEKFSEKVTSCHVVLDSEHVEKKCEITMHTFNQQVVAIGKADNLGKAIDEAIRKAERQLIKINEKIKDHKKSEHRHSHTHDHGETHDHSHDHEDHDHDDK